MLNNTGMHGSHEGTLLASILYYDPDPAWREAVSRDLAASAGAEVLTAATFREAVSLARSTALDAIAADPPGIEVVPFVSAVRQVGTTVPIILFMPRDLAPAALEGMNGGAERYVEKGESAGDRISALGNAVGAATGRRRSERSLVERA
jgi:DNA-binding response OmpR family regulator